MKLISDKELFHTLSRCDTKIKSLSNDIKAFNTKLASILYHLQVYVDNYGSELIPDSLYNILYTITNNLNFDNITLYSNVDAIYNLYNFDTSLKMYNVALGYDPKNSQDVLAKSAVLLADSGSIFNNDPDYSEYYNLGNVIFNNHNLTSSPSITYIKKSNTIDSTLTSLIQQYNGKTYYGSAFKENLFGSYM